jgi:UDP-N-acetylmuramate--alanine ligase
MFSIVKNIHFVGIGGIGMSGIAEILLNQGFNVSGSDMNESDNTEYLRAKGAEVHIGHSKNNLDNAEVVVYSSAVEPNENFETLEAKRRNIPIIKRSQMLAEVSKLKYSLAVAGTHGKTTTTSIAGKMLIDAGFDPTVIVGGRLKDFGGTNARLGNGEWTVIEADEYDRSFLSLDPAIAIINNIELDHVDIYEDYDDVLNTFIEFANKVPFYGFIALGIDDKGAKEIISKINKKIVTFGLDEMCNYKAVNIITSNGTSKFDIMEFNKKIGEIELNIPGEHNIKNALAAIAVGKQLKIDTTKIINSIESFEGVLRRFDRKGKVNNIDIIDDYAHHPSEIRATLDALKNSSDSRIVAAFQPHTYTRTQALYKEFGASFDNADVLLITDVYPAREKPIEGINGELIANQAIKHGHKNVLYFKNLEELKAKIRNVLMPGDTFITLGAGDICDVGEYLLKK